MTGRVIASRARVYLAATMLRLSAWLYQEGRAIIEDEERRWGLAPVSSRVPTVRRLR